MSKEKENKELLPEYYSKLQSWYNMWMGTQHKALDWAWGLSAVVVSILLGSGQYPNIWTVLVLLLLLVILSAIYKRAVISHIHLRAYLQLSKDFERVFIFANKEAKPKDFLKNAEKLDVNQKHDVSVFKYMKNILFMGFLPIIIAILGLIGYNLYETTDVLLKAGSTGYIVGIYLFLLFAFIFIGLSDIRYIYKRYGS